jgi:hypothetical protein
MYAKQCAKAQNQKYKLFSPDVKNPFVIWVGDRNGCLFGINLARQSLGTLKIVCVFELRGFLAIGVLSE